MTHAPSWVALTVTALLALGGCAPADEPVAPPVDASPPIDAPAPQGPASFVSLATPPAGNDLVFRIAAPPDRPLFLENCNGAIGWGLEHADGGERPAWVVEMNGCHSAPIEIAAGAVREFRETLVIRPHDDLRPGAYRVAVYGLYFVHDARDHAAGVEVPLAQRLSPPFERR